MWNRKRNAAFALIALASWACSPDEYPSEPRFEAPPEEVELPDGELFFFTPPAGVTVTSVSVPGEFNNWTPGTHEMIELPDGRWVAGIDLEPGEYQYKYHFNGTSWAGNMCGDATWGDPANNNQVDPDLDSCNGENAVRQVGPPGHNFRYIVPDGVDVTQVNVVGTLNNWTAPDPALRMTRTFSITLDLPAGEHQYKFFFNGDTWADNMCSSTTWGDAANGGRISPDAETCNGDGNVVFTLDEAESVTFRYVVPTTVEVSQVNLVGTINGWSAPDPAMEMDQEYNIIVDLAEGDYQYKYFFNGDTWADNMCSSDTWGDPNNGGRIAPDAEECNGDGNALLTID